MSPSLHRHTLRVNILRWTLPVLGVLVLIAVVAWPAIKEFQINRASENSKTRLKVEAVSMSKDMELQVSHPEYSGLDDKNRPYVITADRVIQQGIKADTEMNLEKPVATLTLNRETKDNVSLKAETGFYDPKVKTLQLGGPVQLTHSNGYTLDMQDLFVDLAKGSSISNNPVSGSGPAGQLSGESMELRDRGNHIILKGRSKIILNAGS